MLKNTVINLHSVPCLSASDQHLTVHKVYDTIGFIRFFRVPFMPQTPYYIAIVGPSGSGKSTLSENLQQHCLNELSLPVQVVSEDAYYHPLDHLSLAQRTEQNFDTPDALDHDLLLKHLCALQRGETVAMPRYDFTRHTRLLDTDTLQPSPVVILEGLFLLTEPRLRAHFQHQIFITLPEDLCLARRLARDQRERGRSTQSVRQQFLQTVVPGYAKFVAPYKPYADTMIDGQLSPQAMLEAAWLALKPQLKTLRN